MAAASALPDAILSSNAGAIYPRISSKPGVTLSYLLALSLCCASGAVPAHEGHHEAEPEAVAPAVPPAPRATLDTPQVELVVQREGADVVLYLDDYATNAPLNGLQLSVRSGTLTQQAAPSGEGTYRIAGDLIDGRGEQPLEITVNGAGVDAQLQAVLPAAVAVDHPGTPEAAPRAAWWIAVVPAVLILLGGGWLLRRRREGRAAPGLGSA